VKETTKSLKQKATEASGGDLVLRCPQGSFTVQTSPITCYGYLAQLFVLTDVTDSERAIIELENLDHIKPI